MTTQARTSNHHTSTPIDRTNADRQRRFRERQKQKQQELTAAIESERIKMIENLNFNRNEITRLSRENSKLIELNKSLTQKIKLIGTIIEEIRQSLNPTDKTVFQIQMDARGLTEALKQD